MEQYSVRYILGFCFLVCLVCSVVVSATAVGLRARQEVNKQLDRQSKVLLVAGLIKEKQRVDQAQIQKLFRHRIKAVIVDLQTGKIDPEATRTASTFDQEKARNDPATSRRAPKNLAGILRLPYKARVFLVSGARIASKEDPFKPSQYIFPIEGKGLWSTLYGYIALAPDLNEVLGITFYQHGETPGLGGEIDNPSWRAKWSQRMVFGPKGSEPSTWGQVRIKVIKGAAGPPQRAPHQVDGLSGATITGNGVTHLVRFWLGSHGFGPFIKRQLATRRAHTHQQPRRRGSQEKTP